MNWNNDTCRFLLSKPKFKNLHFSASSLISLINQIESGFGSTSKMTLNAKLLKLQHPLPRISIDLLIHEYHLDKEIAKSIYMKSPKMWESNFYPVVEQYILKKSYREILDIFDSVFSKRTISDIIKFNDEGQIPQVALYLEYLNRLGMVMECPVANRNAQAVSIFSTPIQTGFFTEIELMNTDSGENRLLYDEMMKLYKEKSLKSCKLSC